MKSLLRSFYVILFFSIPLFMNGQPQPLNSYTSASAVILLDFDGHLVDGTIWNWSGSPINCAASGLSTAQQKEVFERVAEDFRPFNINITTDEAAFIAAPIDKKMRVIITTTSGWYGNAGGVSVRESFTWGDDTPCFVFSALLGYKAKNIAEAASHEAGHTLGLYHQSIYDANCKQITNYYAGQGTGEIGWAPIMGDSYSRNFTLWSNGTSSQGCTNYQDDLKVITSTTNGFGYRPDDHGNTFKTATSALVSNNQFAASGVVQQNTDMDMFRFTMPYKGRFQLDAVPYNVGVGNAGSNLDMQVTLYNGNENLLNVYNPGTLLSSVADTTLEAGNYFLKIEGKGNLYTSAYASLGSYTLKGNIVGGIALPLHKLELRGVQNGDMHQLNWVIVADEKIEKQLVEVSTDGRNFYTLAEIADGKSSYAYRPSENNTINYRLNVTFDDGHRYYSNNITIRKNDAGPRPKLLSNVISSNNVSVSSPENYNYTILDITGKVIRSGQLLNGNNTIQVNSLVTGMYMIRMGDNDRQWTEKILRQ